MSKVDDELTRRLRRAERPVDDALFEGLARRRSHRERLRKVQSGMLAFAVLAATAGGFVALQAAFDGNGRTTGETPSPDLPANGEIVFSAEGRDGYDHLFAMRPDGSRRRQITDFGTNDTDPHVSPDGRTIAFVHQLEDVNPAIATIPMKGGTVTWQTPEGLSASDPAWSPDGTRIAFVGRTSGRAALHVMRVNREPEPLTSRLNVHTAEPTWSPDGTRIAFALRGTTGPWGLASIRPDGTGLEPLRTPDDDEDAPAWSPDGSRIAFVSTYEGNDGIWTMPSAGGEARLVAYAAELEHDLAWAPDGSALLVSDGEWIYRMEATPSGDPQENLVRLVKGSSPAWQPRPAGSAPPSPVPEPSPSPSPGSVDADIGLGFRLCHMSRLDGVDFLGDGTFGIAWVGTRMRGNGSCPEQEGPRAVVAADFHGDGIADAWTGIDQCVGCQPWATTDLDANGADELVVLLQGGTTPQYGFYHAVPEGRPRSSGIYPVFVAAPGTTDAGFPGNQPMTIWAGGDEGYSYAVRCEGYPDDPVLVVASSYRPVDTDVSEIHVTRLRLETSTDLVHAEFVVIESTSPAEADEDLGGDAKACGVDFNPWA